MKLALLALACAPSTTPPLGDRASAASSTGAAWDTAIEHVPGAEIKPEDQGCNPLFLAEG